MAVPAPFKTQVSDFVQAHPELPFSIAVNYLGKGVTYFNTQVLPALQALPTLEDCAKVAQERFWVAPAAAAVLGLLYDRSWIPNAILGGVALALDAGILSTKESTQRATTALAALHAVKVLKDLYSFPTSHVSSIAELAFDSFALLKAADIMTKKQQ